MSADVQPKKRKDKKRRKDDGEQVSFHTNVPLPTTHVVSDDVNIHIHKESGTGGGLCAKFVFFILFSALAVLIGLIITEHRGLTDLDSIDSDSKYSQIFKGWIDADVPNLENHDVEEHIEAQDEHDLDREDEENMNSIEDEENDLSYEEDVSELSKETTVKEQEDENDNVEDDYEKCVGESEEIVDFEENSNSIQASEERKYHYKSFYENDNSEEKEVDDEHVDNEQNNANSEDKYFLDLKYANKNVDEESGEEEKQVQNNMQSEEKHYLDEQDDLEFKKEQKSDNYIQENVHNTNFLPNSNEETDSDQDSGDSNGYENINITNKDDYYIKEQLDESDKHVENE